jgi:hypothetical protein
MQKVVGSNPISRFRKGLHLQVFSCHPGVKARAQVASQRGEEVWPDRVVIDHGAPVSVGLEEIPTGHIRKL